jgi:hypothetical protein
VTRLITIGIVVLRLQEFGSMDLKRIGVSHSTKTSYPHQNELSFPDGRSSTPVPIIIFRHYWHTYTPTSKPWGWR